MNEKDYKELLQHPKRLSPIRVVVGLMKRFTSAPARNAVPKELKTLVSCGLIEQAKTLI